MSNDADRARADMYVNGEGPPCGLGPNQGEPVYDAMVRAHLAGQASARAEWAEERRLLMVANSALRACVSDLSQQQKEWAEERELLIQIKGTAENYTLNPTKRLKEAFQDHDEWLATQSSEDHDKGKGD